MIADEERGFQVSNLVEVEFEANQIWIIQDLPITEIDIRPVLSQPLNQKRFTSVEATLTAIYRIVVPSCIGFNRQGWGKRFIFASGRKGQRR